MKINGGGMAGGVSLDYFKRINNNTNKKKRVSGIIKIN